jgi:hypothetical protein
MSLQNEPLSEFETIAIAALQAVDLDTPAQQLRRAMEALLDVPTIARTGETAWSRQAAAALAMVSQDVQRLHAAVQALGAHLERPPSAWRSGLKGPCALTAGGASPVGCGPGPYSQVAE